MNSMQTTIAKFIDELVHFGRLRSSSDATKQMRTSTTHVYLEALYSHVVAWSFGGKIFWRTIRNHLIMASLLRPLPDRVPGDTQFWCGCLARLLHRHVLGQNTILYQGGLHGPSHPDQTSSACTRFPSYSDGTKLGHFKSLASHRYCASFEI